MFKSGGDTGLIGVSSRGEQRSNGKKNEIVAVIEISMKYWGSYAGKKYGDFSMFLLVILVSEGLAFRLFPFVL